MADATSTGMQIRNATLEDAEAILQIHAYYVSNSLVTMEEDIPTLDATREHLKSIRAQGLPYLVATDQAEQVICGYAYAGRWSERRGYRYAVVDSIYLLPDSCGKGVGTKLLEALIRKLQATDKTQLLASIAILPTQKVEDLPSTRLHIRCGFEVVGRLKAVGVKLGTTVDVLTLQRSLREHASPISL